MIHDIHWARVAARNVTDRAALYRIARRLHPEDRYIFEREHGTAAIKEQDGTYTVVSALSLRQHHVTPPPSSEIEPRIWRCDCPSTGQCYAGYLARWADLFGGYRLRSEMEQEAVA